MITHAGVWSDISYLTRVMQDLLGDLTFQEAYVNRCIISILIIEPYSKDFEYYGIECKRVRVTTATKLSHST